MVLVSIIRFSGMTDLVVWSKITLDVALWLKSKMAAFAQGQTVNQYHFRHNRGRFVFHGVFRYARYSGVVGKYFRHCIVSGKSKMAAICPRSNNKLVYFSTE